MGIFNIRSTNKKLNDLVPVVSANLSRLSTYFDDNFKYVSRITKREIYGSGDPKSDIIITKQSHIDEFMRLKEEFESEFQYAQSVLQDIKPRNFIEEDRYYNQWNNELAGIAMIYNALLKNLQEFEIYTEK